MPGLTTSTDNGIARIQFDRPDVLNALSPEVLGDLIETCTNILKDETIRVVVFTGAGDNFSSGADLPQFHKGLVSDPLPTADLGRRAAEAIAELPQITIAAIRGHCVGGALVLAAACDIRIAADDSRFFIPELDAGIPLAWGGMAHMVRLVGESLAADLVLTCRPFGAEEAMQSGFVSRIIPVASFGDEASGIAETIAKKPALALRLTKQQLGAIRKGTFDARLDAKALLASLADKEAKSTSDAYVANLTHQDV
jgi:enoyl-CoA hydratase/carnithine racemase